MMSYFIAGTTLISSISQAQTVQTGQDLPAQQGQQQQKDSTEYSKIEKIWTDFTSAISAAKIKLRVNLPSNETSQGLGLGGGYRLKSEANANQSYSGVDVWEIRPEFYPSIFGLNESLNVSGISTGREITFIRQFPNRSKSLLRLPYNPLKRLPIKSSKFFEEDIQPGDFISFRAPMTLSLGVGVLEKLRLHQVSLSSKLLLQGEFFVQIFRMDNNRVRTRIMLYKDHSLQSELSARLIGLDTIGEKIVGQILNPKLLSFLPKSSDSNLFTLDYIFNLNHAESRDLYDQVLGHSIRLDKLDSIQKQLQLTNIFDSHDKSKKRLIADYSYIEALSAEDQNKPSDERRVTKVQEIDIAQKSNTLGLSLNLLRALDVRYSKSDILSHATVQAQNKATADKYILESVTNDMSYRLLWIWGERDLQNSHLLLRANNENQPESIVGFLSKRIVEDSSIERDQFNDIKNRYLKILPAPMRDQLRWPRWDFKNNLNQANNVYIENSLYFNENLFKVQIETSKERIKQELQFLIENYGHFKSLPMGTSATATDIQDPRYESFVKRDYKSAYDKNWELTVIPHYLEIVLNANNSKQQRYWAYRKLTQEVPLFVEIQGLLVLRLIPEAELSKVAVGYLLVKGQDLETTEIFYPSKEEYQKLSVLNEMVQLSEYTLNRSITLKPFIKHDGQLYTEEEIVKSVSK